MKSANALSGEMPDAMEPENSCLFSGLTWILKQTPRIKQQTQEMNPERKELKGKVPTRRQYKN